MHTPIDTSQSSILISLSQSNKRQSLIETEDDNLVRIQKRTRYSPFKARVQPARQLLIGQKRYDLKGVEKLKQRTVSLKLVNEQSCRDMEQVVIKCRNKKIKIKLGFLVIWGLNLGSFFILSLHIGHRTGLACLLQSQCCLFLTLCDETCDLIEL
ncbi:hypothetical protein BpHYR1_052343 [Brachionus plicatilis]|uniref:Uncharacterized protein n=1 Tax=Brachionus plicatilis TaxID=10195 RepID=A0A3M7PGW7_BRAPC|nr:hypothetical protein BpHYR1_052343 [Brachionus plicatilis]